MKHVIVYLDTALNGERAWSIQFHDEQGYKYGELVNGPLATIHARAKELAAKEGCRCFVELT